MNTYFMKFPKKVFSGCGTLDALTEIVAQQDARHVCLLTDKGVARAGIAVRMLEILSRSKAEVRVFDALASEPTIDDVKALYASISSSECDLIVAVGGGSVIDCAKLMAAAMANPPFVSSDCDSNLILHTPLPTVMLPTSAGTGAEVTANAIVTFPEKQLKIGILSDAMIPTYVILDPTLTVSLPAALTASTGIDALCHALESYISTLHNPISRLFSVKAIQLICENIEIAYCDGSNLVAREAMQLGAFFAGQCLNSSSTCGVHALSYPLGGRFHIPHGIANAILLPHVIAASREAIVPELSELAPILLSDPGLSTAASDAMANKVIEGLFALVGRLGIPSTLTELGITRGDLDALTDGALDVKRLLSRNPKPLGREDILGIYSRLL